METVWRTGEADARSTRVADTHAPGEAPQNGEGREPRGLFGYADVEPLNSNRYKKKHRLGAV